MPSLGGLNNLAKTSADVPADLLARLLLKNETVLGQFDTFYPDAEYSPRVQIYLTIFTVGLYQVWLFLRYLWRICKHLLCQCECCADPIDFTRAKLILTSSGRLIHWQQQVRQANHVDQQTYHNVEATTSVYHLEDLAQITLQYSDHNHFLCCCHDYLTGVKLTFRSFDVAGTVATSQYTTVSDAAGYLHRANSELLLDTFSHSADRADCRHSLGCRAPVSLLLLSNPDDHIYDGEYGLEPFEDLLKFHQHVCSLMTNVRGEVSKGRRKHAGGASGSSGSSSAFMAADDADLSFPPTFLTAKALRSEEFKQKFGDGGGESTNVLPGVKELLPLDTISNFTLVEPDGYVNVPLRYINLHPHEEVIAAVGMRYKWTASDYLVYCLTLGFLRFNLFAKRVYNTTAVVLTSHRIVEIVLCQHKGKVPTELGKMDMWLQSYYPKQVLSGSVQVVDRGRQVLSSLLTAHGAITLRLPSIHFVFAQRMQLVAARMQPIPIGAYADLEARLPDLSHLLAAAGDEALPVTTYSVLDKLLLPLLPREELVFKHRSGERFQPWLCCRFFSFTPNQLHSSTNVLYNMCNSVRLLQCWSCRTLPRQVASSAVLTSHTMFYINYAHTGTGSGSGSGHDELGHSKIRQTCCSAKQKTDYFLDPFSFIWVPVRSVREHSLTVINSGAKPLSQSCCALHTRSFRARYILHVQSSLGLVFPFAEDVRFKAWNKDIGLARFQSALGAVTVAIQEEMREED